LFEHLKIHNLGGRLVGHSDELSERPLLSEKPYVYMVSKLWAR
jgi:hypothetical protein